MKRLRLNSIGFAGSAEVGAAGAAPVGAGAAGAEQPAIKMTSRVNAMITVNILLDI